jgi:putative thiamine transport system ATP-binding protein
MNVKAEIESALALREVRIELRGRLLCDLTVSVPPASVVTLMGPSGAGKSMLLAYVSGTLPAAFKATGEVWLGGRRIDVLPAHERRTGLLFQDDLLFPHLSVNGNLLFAIPPGSANRSRRRKQADDALARAGLAGFGDRDPATLSGGQRARVALLRVLLSQPRALLLDEPFAKLDPEIRETFRRYVFDEARARMLPVLMVTHDPADRDAAGGPAINLTGGFD